MKTATVLLVVMLPLSVEARPIENWPYERLMEESDLVVIGKVESVQDFDGEIEIRQFAEFLTPEVTTFTVAGVLQGEHDGETLELVHCRHRTENLIPPNGPLLARFESEERTIRIESGAFEGTEVLESPPSYLLFLKRRDDGRYEPVNGQVDSEMSFRRLTSAFGF